MIGSILTGLGIAMKAIDVISNNVANAKVTGFKSSDPMFSDVYSKIYSGRTEVMQGLGAANFTTRQSHKQGPLTSTGGSLDLALIGNGMFILSGNGEAVYSRDGSFRMDKGGFIVANDGRKLLGGSGAPIHVPLTNDNGTLLTELKIDVNGRVFGTYGSGIPSQIDTIPIAVFSNPNGLRQLGQSQYQATSSSGSPKFAFAGSLGVAKIQSGSLEMSNADITSELSNLLKAQQAFSASSRLLQADT